MGRSRPHVSFGRRRVPIVLLFALLGMLPDIDLLIIESHRSATHSLLAVGVVGLVARGVARGRPRVWLASAAAYASHLLLDWLGTDTVAPIGIMVLWPFDVTAYQSSFDWFYPICREYWLLECWIAVAWSSKLNTPSSLQPCSSSPIKPRDASADNVVFPVPDRPKKSATSPPGPTLAEQCIGRTPAAGSR